MFIVVTVGKMRTWIISAVLLHRNQKWGNLNWNFGLFVSHENHQRGNGTPLQYSCLENPMDRGAWWAAAHGVAKSRTWLNDFTFTFCFHALQKEMATHSSVLASRIPGMGEPGGLPSMGSHRVGHDWSGLAAAAACGSAAKNLPTMQETWVWSLGWEDPLDKEKVTHSSILAWKIPWTV